MNFSTDLPSGERAIAEYLSQNHPLMVMNVSKAADDVYRREKKLYRFETKPRTEKEFARQDAKWAKIVVRRARKSGALPTGWAWCAYESCKMPFKPGRATQTCCTPRCKYRWQQAQPTEEVISS